MTRRPSCYVVLYVSRAQPRFALTVIAKPTTASCAPFCLFVHVSLPKVEAPGTSYA